MATAGEGGGGALAVGSLLPGPLRGPTGPRAHAQTELSPRDP